MSGRERSVALKSARLHLRLRVLAGLIVWSVSGLGSLLVTGSATGLPANRSTPLADGRRAIRGTVAWFGTAVSSHELGSSGYQGYSPGSVVVSGASASEGDDEDAVGYSFSSDEVWRTGWVESLPARSRGSELVRLFEGGEDPDDDDSVTDQPFPVLHQRAAASDESEASEELRLFSSSELLLGRSPAPGQLPFVRQAGQRKGSAKDAALVDGVDAGHTSSSRLSAFPSNQSKEEDLTAMAASSPLTRVSDFFRDLVQRFGGPQTTRSVPAPANPTSGIQRLLPHRFRPHFVNTAKGLRNIPHQLNDGQLQLAPEDAAPGTGSPSSHPSSGPGGGAATGGGRNPGASGGSTGTLGTLLNNFKRKLKAIYPGTVWCGDGNQAKSEDDIGFFYLTDSCCRAHDLCPITIAAGEQFNRLKNNGHFTRSHCDCDKQFFNCLKNANTLVSRQIGYTYFNLLKPQCFRHEHPKLNCTKRRRGKCLTYAVDEQQPKRWQWFDNLTF